MAEYIDREAVEKAIDSVYTDLYPDYVPNSIAAVRECLIVDVGIIPAADVQPVRRGRWDFQGYQLFKCTNCKEMFTQDQLEAMQNHKDCEECAFPNFCPHCGADMRGDENG